MNKPHKHAEPIKAWADGVEVEVYSDLFGKWVSQPNPSWCLTLEYRIKPKRD